MRGKSFDERKVHRETDTERERKRKHGQVRTMAYFRKKSFRFPSQPFSIQLRQPFFNVGLSPTPHQQKRRTPLVKNTIQGKNLLAAKNSLPTIFNFLLILVFMVRLK